MVVNRLDAAQHFFGYALTKQLQGGSVARLQSEYGKEQQYWSPKTAAWTQYLHGEGVDSVEGGFNVRAGNPFAILPGTDMSYIGKYRTRWEIELDKFYNNLGMSFGSSLQKNNDLLPSQILNKRANELRKVQMGLQTSLTLAWQAYDPKAEGPKAYFLPPSERERLSLSDGEKSLLRTHGLGSAPLPLIRKACQVGGLDDESWARSSLKETMLARDSRQYCAFYNLRMQEIATELRARVGRLPENETPK